MNPETGRTYRLSVRVASDPSGGDWFGGHQDEWWREGWGSSYLWRSAPTLLIAGRGQRAYLGGVRGARVDAATGLETTYDLALTADPDGLISWREAASLIGTWWRQRHEPAAWPLGAALDRWDRTTAYASGVVSVRPTALPTAPQVPLPAGVPWVETDHPAVPRLLVEAMAGTGPAVAYFQIMSPDWADHMDLPSGALLLVDPDEPPDPAAVMDQMDGESGSTRTGGFGPARTGLLTMLLLIGLYALALAGLVPGR